MSAYQSDVPSWAEHAPYDESWSGVPPAPDPWLGTLPILLIRDSTPVAPPPARRGLVAQVKLELRWVGIFLRGVGWALVFGVAGLVMLGAVYNAGRVLTGHAGSAFFAAPAACHDTGDDYMCRD